MTPRNHTPGAGGEPAPPFEESLERLEHIVEELEGGSLTLEDSIARYEEGVQLSRRLTHELDAAEKRIERLVGGDDATPPSTTPMELDPAAESERPRGRAPLEERRAVPASRPPAAPRREESAALRPPPEPDELPF